MMIDRHLESYLPYPNFNFSGILDRGIPQCAYPVSYGGIIHLEIDNGQKYQLPERDDGSPMFDFSGKYFLDIDRLILKLTRFEIPGESFTIRPLRHGQKWGFLAEDGNELALTLREVSKRTMGPNIQGCFHIIDGYWRPTNYKEGPRTDLIFPLMEHLESWLRS